MPRAEFAEAIRRSGLVAATDRGLAMVSGGADSVALLTGLVELMGPERLVALHVNYGLRDEAGADEALVRRLCEEIGVECEVHRAGAPAGNVQAWARDVRHREAERIRVERSLDWIAVGHNRSDLAETFLYRLAVSPGTRPLLAMPPRSGNLIRPLLALDRRQIRSGLEGAADFADDASNEDRAYARNRIRLEVMPELRQINPAAELNIARTRAELAEDEALLQRLTEQAMEPLVGAGDDGLPGEALLRLHPALRRRVLRMFAEAALGRPVPISRSLTEETMRLAAAPEGGDLDLGEGARFLIEAGWIRVHLPSSDLDVPAAVAIPPAGGVFTFGDWEIEAVLIDPTDARRQFGRERSAFFDVDALPAEGLVVRAKQSGDRIEPLGMEGSRALQDVFTDPRSPRSERGRWPIFVAADKVLWVPGLAVSRHFILTDATKRALRITLGV